MAARGAWRRKAAAGKDEVEQRSRARRRLEKRLVLAKGARMAAGFAGGAIKTAAVSRACFARW